MTKYAIVGFESLSDAFEGSASKVKAYAFNQSQIRVLSANEVLADVMAEQPPFALENQVALSDVAATIQRADPSYVWRFIACEITVSLIGQAR